MKRTFLLLLLLCSMHLFAQNTSSTHENSEVSDRLVEQLHSVSGNNISDVVYLQTSKTIYETEEDLWFKGYVLDEQYFTPSARNKILFVQLIEDKTDKVVWENKYEIENGFVNGHLFLESSLPEGTYTLAAYSSASYNKNTKEFYAAKKIEILRTINKKAVAIPVQKDTTFQFTTFPEGGNLVSGIQGTLAFKAVNSKGIPMNISGTLYEDNKPLLDFKSSHAGMGSLVFVPDANKKYHIQLTEPASKEQFPLTKIYRSGKVLQLLSNTKEAVSFKILQNPASNEETVYLRLQIRGQVYSIAKGFLKKELTIRIYLKDVPQGIAEVTLFDANTIPLAERLVYINQDQKLNIKTELNKSDFAIREKASLKIKVTDPIGQPIVAHLGLSVYDKIYQNKQDSKNILTHYFLSTQLKGNIYNPAYYFNEKNTDRQEALNLLLLTQGWRNYVWEESNLKEFGNILKPIVYDDMVAKIGLKMMDKKTKGPQPQSVAIFAADESKGSDFLMADAMGLFVITPDHLKKGEGGYTYLKLLTPTESKYRINIKDFPFEEINKERKIKTTLYPIPTALETTAEISPTFVTRPEVNKLKEVLITSKKKQMFRDKYIGKLDSLSKLKPNYVCINGILNCPNHPPYAGYNRNQQLTEAQLLEMFNIASLKGYYGKKKFYEPIYDEVTINDNSPDYRNTLFWKSDIITNEQGEASVDFFCSDIYSVFLGNIEGVSGDGLLGSENFEFSVRKK